MYARASDFGGANLEGARLQATVRSIGSQFIGCNFYGASMTGAELTGALFIGADFRGADLTGANMQCADLSGAKLNGADLTGADLTGAYVGREKPELLVDIVLERDDLPGRDAQRRQRRHVHRPPGVDAVRPRVPLRHTLRPRFGRSPANFVAHRGEIGDDNGCKLTHR